MPPHGALSVFDGFGAVLAGADSDRVLDVDDEDLAVADLAMVAGPRGLRQLVDNGLHYFGLHHRLNLEPGNQRDVDGGAAVLFRVAALGATALDLGHSDSGNAALVEHVLHFLQALVPDDRHDHFHAADPSPRAGLPTGSGDRSGLTVEVSACR